MPTVPTTAPHVSDLSGQRVCVNPLHGPDICRKSRHQRWLHVRAHSLRSQRSWDVHIYPLPTTLVLPASRSSSAETANGSHNSSTCQELPQYASRHEE
jgi:hypothetical protein